MKIALLHYSAPPVVGGVESVLGHHARLMSEAGHQVQIVAGRGSQTDERIRFVEVPFMDSRHLVILSVKEQLDKGVIPRDFDEHVGQLTETLREILLQTDCLVAHNICSLNKNLILTAALKRISEQRHHPRFILWHHDLAWTTPRYRNELFEGYPWDLLCTAWEGADQVTISDFRRHELADLMKIPEDEISVIPNGVDITRFLKLEPKTEALLNGLDLLNAFPILLLPVRITSRKNIELALYVLKELGTHFPQATLVVTGPLGPHNAANRGYFEKLLALRTSLSLDDAVIFLAELTSDYLPDEIVSDFYKLADALFLPSREEGFGIPILEAGLAGLPVFCANIPPLRDLGGTFVNYFSLGESPARIAAAIAEKLSDSMVFGLRVQVRSRYAWRQIYQQQIERLLRKGER